MEKWCGVRKGWEREWLSQPRYSLREKLPIGPQKPLPNLRYLHPSSSFLRDQQSFPATFPLFSPLREQEQIDSMWFHGPHALTLFLYSSFLYTGLLLFLIGGN